MNFKRVLIRKPVIVATLVAMAALVIALVAMPVGAINQLPAPPGVGGVLNSPVPVPSMINYQGYLTDPDGKPINGTLPMTFSIYEVALEGTPVWQETHASVSVTNGLFNVLLGSINPVDASHLTGESYLGVQVGDNPEMVPRQPMVSVAYALRADVANNAETLEGMHSTDFVAVAGDTMTGPLFLPADGLVAGTDQLVLTSGRVGIGTTSPTQKLEVAGTIYAESDEYIGVYGKCSSGNAGVIGEHANGHWGALGCGNEGVYGYSDDGYGVVGQSSGGIGVFATSTDNYGIESSSYYSSAVHGYNLSNDNYGQLGNINSGVHGSSDYQGVYGVNTVSNNHGVLGTQNEGVLGYDSGSGNYGRLGTENAGVYGKNSGSGTYGRLGTPDEGVYGEYAAGGSYGMLGAANYGAYGYDADGCGVRGDGGDNGVYGYSIGGSGVHGINSGSGNYGILGTGSYGVYGSSSSGYGVHGVSMSGYGVYGINSGSGNYGELGTSGYGVYGYGDVYGVEGYSDASGNYGVLGTPNEGVWGHTDSTIGSAVCGEYNAGESVGKLGTYSIGVVGVITSSGGTGVYGSGPSGGYDFYAGGAGTNYGAFTGAHDVKLADGFAINVQPGLIVSVTGETYVRTDQGEISYSSTLPTVKLADTPNDKKVAGVIISESSLPEDHWYQAGEGERFGIVNALGEGLVWVTNINGDIEPGDYITTSSIAGYGQKQDDDLLHSYTLGKATETVDWSQVTETVEFDGQTYKAYAIAVFYTSG